MIFNPFPKLEIESSIIYGDSEPRYKTPHFFAQRT